MEHYLSQSRAPLAAGHNNTLQNKAFIQLTLARVRCPDKSQPNGSRANPDDSPGSRDTIVSRHSLHVNCARFNWRHFELFCYLCLTFGGKNVLTDFCYALFTVVYL